jgi:hypothetical protein
MRKMACLDCFAGGKFIPGNIKRRYTTTLDEFLFSPFGDGK